MTREEKNSKAYQDVLDFQLPSMLDDQEYLDCYTYWKSVSGFEDEEFGNVTNDFEEDFYDRMADQPVPVIEGVTLNGKPLTLSQAESCNGEHINHS